MYTEIISYRLYRLHSRKSFRNHSNTGRVKNYIKIMGLPMQENHFTGKDPIRILNFLESFGRESNIQGMRESKEFIELSEILRG